MEKTVNNQLRLASFSDASRQVGVDLRAIHRMIATGELKTIPMPGGVRNKVLQSSIDELLAKMHAAANQAG